MLTFLTGIQRVLNCSKAQVATAGLATTWLAVRYAALDLPPTQRTSLWVAFVGAVAVALREVINAWTEEDVAKATGGQKPVTPTAPAATQPPPAAPQSLSNPTPTPYATSNPTLTITTKPISTSPLPQRSPTMPLRTKLPLIAIALITLTTTTACQSPPDLAIYREGLHRIDEPLYQAHLLLMDDAVKGNLRTEADRQVVQRGVAGARAIYDEAVK